jgi:hypothetical protein
MKTVKSFAVKDNSVTMVQQLNMYRVISNRTGVANDIGYLTTYSKASELFDLFVDLILQEGINEPDDADFIF